MKKELWMIFILILVATVSAGILGFVNITTRPIIKKNEVRNLRRSVLNVFHISYKDENLAEKFKSTIETKTVKGEDVFLRFTEKGKLSGLAFKINGSGFQGPISGLIALKPDLVTILGLEILNQQETPGLGARITEEWFLSQFAGQKIQPKILVAKEGSGKAKNKVDAITGATRTSKAVQEIMNEEVKYFREQVLTEKVIEGWRHE